MRPRGVTVTVFAPGGIATEMTAGERFNDLRSWLVPVGPCAREAILGLKRRRYLVIPGIVYGWGARLTRLVPQSLLVGRVAAQYRNSLLKTPNLTRSEKTQRLDAAALRALDVGKAPLPS
jgi:short-subunit dehydrogenase